jgi:hypothetical protein
MPAETWTLPEPPEADGPTVGDERAMTVAYLGHQRRTLLAIAAGLTGEELARPALPPSTLTLLGLIRHLAKVERIWLRERFGGEQLEPLYDPALGKDADFEDLDPARAEQDVARLRAEWARSDEVAASIDLDATIDHRGETLSLRFVYLHLIHEYARHNGHADLLRQAIDGVTGR